MDKSWMSKNRLSDEYKAGVESFMQFATHNAPDEVLISCPCTRCGNLTSKRKDLVKMHLLSNGIDLTYHSWIWHGETCASSYSMHHGDDQFREPIEMVHAAHEDIDNPSKFIELVEDAEKPLYEGCTKFSKLSAIVKLFNLKAKHSWSDSSFTDLLTIFGDMLPSPNELPLNIYEAKKSLVSMGLEYEKIHACLNDCVLYRNEYAEYTTCPTCGASIWKECSNTSMKNSIPAKVLWYFSPIPRFQRMFRNKELSKDLRWHADQRVKDGFLRHPADSPNWKVVDHRWPEFQGEPRLLRLALSADGINPHSLMSSKYSCWPVLLVIYNLPPWLCFKRKFIMLTLLISGPRQPGNDIDFYLAPLIDDLTHLWKIGVPAYDVFRDERFLLKVVLLCTINDFPAYGNLSGYKVKGYHACPICGEDTCAKRLKHSRKMSYTGHRRFLDQSHPYRRQKKVFDGTQEFRTAPKPMSGSQILKSVAAIQCKWGKLNKVNKDEDKRILKKKSIFFELEYWEHLHVRHCLDVKPISYNCIVVYLWVLFKKIKDLEKVAKYRFVDPYGIGHIPSTKNDKKSIDERTELRSRALAAGLHDTLHNQLLLAPCNVGEHWILTVIDPHKEEVGIMDPLFNSIRDGVWKQVVNVALKIFSADKQQTPRKTPKWTIIKGPKQPDGSQCGYYVMRYMKDIIEATGVETIGSLQSLFNKNYSTKEIDEVRKEWADCVQEYASMSE